MGPIQTVLIGLTFVITGLIWFVVLRRVIPGVISQKTSLAFSTVSITIGLLIFAVFFPSMIAEHRGEPEFYRVTAEPMKIPAGGSTSIESVSPAVRQAIESDEPAVIEVQESHEGLVVPPYVRKDGTVYRVSAEQITETQANQLQGKQEQLVDWITLLRVMMVVAALLTGTMVYRSYSAA